MEARVNVVKVVPFVNDTYKENKRIESEIIRMELENKARQYSRRCRAIREAKEEVVYLVEGIALVVAMVSAGLMCAAFM